jgi:hypothetical protein
MDFIHALSDSNELEKQRIIHYDNNFFQGLEVFMRETCNENVY